MGKDNFYKLCGELRPFIQRKVTNMVRWRGLFTRSQIHLTKRERLGTRSPLRKRLYLFETVLFSMRFQGHETVSIGNRVRVNDALVAFQPSSHTPLWWHVGAFSPVLQESSQSCPPWSSGDRCVPGDSICANSGPCE